MTSSAPLLEALLLAVEVRLGVLRPDHPLGGLVLWTLSVDGFRVASGTAPDEAAAWRAASAASAGAIGAALDLVASKVPGGVF